MAIFDQQEEIQVESFGTALVGKIRFLTGSRSSEKVRYEKFAIASRIDLDDLYKLATMRMEPTPEILQKLGLNPVPIEKQERVVEVVIKTTFWYVGADDEKSHE